MTSISSKNVKTLRAELKDVAELFANTTLTYGPVAEGDIIRTRIENFSYKVAALSASDHDVTTAGGLKLYVLPLGDCYYATAFGLIPCKLTINETPEAGAFDNRAAHGAMERALAKICDASGEIVTIVYDGTFAVGFSGARGNYNTSCRISAKKIKIIGTTIPALIALPGMDATVIRTAFSGTGSPDPDFSGEIEYLEMHNFIADGNWGQQTWVGPTGGELLPSPIFDQNGFGVYVVRKVLGYNSGAQNCGQDGFPHASCGDILQYNMQVHNCGKGGTQVPSCRIAKFVDPHVTNVSSSPDIATKPLYTLASDGYPAIAGDTSATLTVGDVTIPTITVVRPKIRSGNGRGILCGIVGSSPTAKSPDLVVIDPDIITQNRHSINLTAPDGTRGGRAVIIGGRMVRLDGGRVISANFYDSLEVLESAEITQGSAAVNPATIVAENIKSATFEVIARGLWNETNTVFFENATGRVVIRNSEIDRINIIANELVIHDNLVNRIIETGSSTVWYAWGNTGNNHRSKFPEELFGSVTTTPGTVSAGAKVDVFIPVTGCQANSVVLSVYGTSTDLLNFAMSTPRVDVGGVQVSLLNTTSGSLILGGAIIRAVVRRQALE